MTSLVERLRVRSDKRPVYHDGDSDDDIPIGLIRGRAKQEKQTEKFARDDTNEDACQACGQSGSLINCGTCTYAYHLKCLLPPRKAAPDDSWSCPECVSPLNQIEKILDCEINSTSAGKNDMATSDSKQKHARRYLVKWKGLSYLHCTWIPEEEFKKAFKTNPRLKTRVNNFKSQMDLVNKSEDEWIGIRPEWTTVDRIIGRRKSEDKYEYYVKWKELGYDECSWEVDSDISAFQPQIDRFLKIRSRGRNKSSTKNKGSSRDSKDLKHKQKEFRQYEQTPEFLTGTLHPYQLEGLNFLRYAWSKKTHVILADEMGLGKTIQSIAFLASLFEENISPHLVIAPLSTLRNWEREFATWAPEMNVVMYFGSAAARAVCRQYEFYHPKDTKKHKKKKTSHDNRSNQQRLKFDVLLTSYEMINLDSSSLRVIPWECMIVDEGHRLKNKDSKLFVQLKIYSPKQRVLLTGTPLQNNLDELFMLMHFLDNGKFPSIEDFQKEFKDINQEEQVSRLHKMLAPHLLRRVKKDVMKDLPPKKELILRVDLSSKQKEFYKAILTRNYQILARRGGAQISLINVVMELRKLCCHAYMLEGVEPLVELDAIEGLRNLVEFSGKMQLLDKMMIKLKEQGHRVLIYSQFQHMLDLLEDYLTYKKWGYERIDGRVSGAERQIRIDRFNAKNSTRFCFLLSTRAGGLGINLATADTVIMYDSDWNPHADLQAMARAHRLGQTNKVMIYRLITRGTIEERMMQLTKKKMILEHLVVGRLKAQQTVNQEELDDIIRYGSKELFADENDEGDNGRQIHYDDTAIERLLNRDQIRDEESPIDDEDEDDDFLKAFKVANFEYIDQVEAAAKEELARKHMADKASSSNSDRANYWDDLLKDRFEVHQVEEFTTMGKGKRSRKQMAATKEGDLAGDHDASSEDEDYSYEDDLSETESLPGNASGRRGRLSRKKARADYIETLPLMEGEGKSLRVLGFNQNQRSTFSQILMRFGFGEYDWKEFVPRLKGKSFDEVHAYGFLFMKHLDEGVNDSPTFSDGVPKEGLRVDDLLIRLAHISLVKEKLKFLKENAGATLFPDDILECYPSLTGRVWKEQHDVLLLEAILRHGYARWQAIAEDKGNGLADVARQELGLPVLSGPFTGGIQMGDAATNNNHTSNGSSEAVKGNLSQDCATLYQFREVQRRIVEFIRKRYHLLEKILDLELCLDEADKANPYEHTSQEPDIGISVSDASCQSPVDTNSLLNYLPVLEPIAADSKVPLDNRVDRLEMAKLYNAMCTIAETNALDAAEACTGNSSSGSRLSKNISQLETVCEDVHRILAAREVGSVAADKVEDGIFKSMSSLSSNGNLNGSSGEAKEADLVEKSVPR